MRDKNHNLNVFERPRSPRDIILEARGRLAEEAVQGFTSVHHGAYATDPAMVLHETHMSRLVLSPETVEIATVTDSANNNDSYEDTSQNIAA